MTTTAPPEVNYRRGDTIETLKLTEMSPAELKSLKMFALVLKRDGYADPASTNPNGWAPMSGNPTDGWVIHNNHPEEVVQDIIAGRAGKCG